MADRTFTPDETLAILRETSDKLGDDWRIRVARKERPSDPPYSLAVFDNAKVEHVAFAETWIGPLFGGAGRQGQYEVSAYHAKSVDKMVGGKIVINAPGAPIEKPEFKMINDKEWKGPPALYYVADIFRAQLRKEGDVPLTSIPGEPPPLLPSAPQSPYGVEGGGGSSPRRRSENGVLGDPATAAIIEARERAARAEADLRASNLDAKRREELAGVMRQTEETIRRLEAEQREQIRKLEERERAAMAATAQKQPEKPQADIAETLMKFAAVLGPIVAPIIQTLSETRRAERESEREARRHERESDREFAREQREADREFKAQQNEILKTILAKQGDNPAAKMIEPIVSAMGTMTQMMMQNATNMAEIASMQQGDEEPTAIRVIREVSRGIAGLAAASARAPRMVPQQPQQQPQQGQQALPPAPQRVPPQQGPQRVPPPNGAPKPTQAPVTEAVVKQQSIADEIEKMIRLGAPTKEVAKKLIVGMRDPALISELAEYDNNPLIMFQKRLGDWLAADPAPRQQYADKVMEDMVTLAEEAGIDIFEFNEGGEAQA